MLRPSRLVAAFFWIIAWVPSPLAQSPLKAKWGTEAASVGASVATDNAANLAANMASSDEYPISAIISNRHGAFEVPREKVCGMIETDCLQSSGQIRMSEFETNGFKEKG